LDTGSHDNLASATDFVRVIEKRQGLKIACLEEIALYKKWMTSEDVEKAAHAHGSSSYGKYLKNLLLKTRNQNNASTYHDMLMNKLDFSP
jgi:glucose-1-phosphate thymidylyltransferase